MATSSVHPPPETGSTITVTQTGNHESSLAAPRSPTVTLKLREGGEKQENNESKDSGRKKVSWTNETVDNEGMGRKSSKCCCIYVKPKTKRVKDGDGSNGQSSEDDSSDEGDCDNCVGHTAKSHSGGHTSDGGGDLPPDGVTS